MRSVKNWKIRCSQVIVFIKTGKLSDVNYRATQRTDTDGITP